MARCEAAVLFELPRRVSKTKSRRFLHNGGQLGFRAAHIDGQALVPSISPVVGGLGIDGPPGGGGREGSGRRGEAKEAKE